MKRFLKRLICGVLGHTHKRSAFCDRCEQLDRPWWWRRCNEQHELPEAQMTDIYNACEKGGSWVRTGPIVDDEGRILAPAPRIDPAYLAHKESHDRAAAVLKRGQ